MELEEFKKLTNMLGYSKNEFLGKRLWENGAFVDARKSREAYKEFAYLSMNRHPKIVLLMLKY